MRIAYQFNILVPMTEPFAVLLTVKYNYGIDFSFQTLILKAVYGYYHYAVQSTTNICNHLLIAD